MHNAEEEEHYAPQFNVFEEDSLPRLLPSRILYVLLVDFFRPQTSSSYAKEKSWFTQNNRAFYVQFVTSNVI
jgi:hypothetical protein